MYVQELVGYSDEGGRGGQGGVSEMRDEEEEEMGSRSGRYRIPWCRLNEGLRIDLG